MLSAVLAAGCSAWAWAGAGWVVDLAANLTAQWLTLAILLALVACPLRRWRAAAVCALCALAAWAGLLATPRADRASGANPDAVVRVLVMNAAPSNRRTDDLVDAIRDADPDVLIVLETPETLLPFLKDGGGLRDRLPHGWVPDHAGESFRAVLTRWPQRGGDDWEAGPWATADHGLRVMRVERPGGAFTLVVAHPASPRTARRWADGNALVERVAAMVNTRLLPEGLPLLVAGDFNSAPAAHRSRLLSGRTGLRRAKPRALPAGTWPAALPWPARAAIDDVFVDGATGVVSWRAVPAPGSDHSAVLVELSLGAR
ncbi:MAG: endonuclease/exonuclease/phosphatase family protein [Phycisphaerales bacterium]|nr:endonuclease/exonuclease/phosphatase family protein [Phycisphaerales bacterium]